MTLCGQDVGAECGDKWFTGDDKTLRFVIDDGAGGTADLTGASWRWGLFAYSSASPGTVALVSKSGAPSDAAAGIIDIDIAGSDTASLSAGRYYHELEITDSSGRVTTAAFGEVFLAAQRLV